MTLHLVLFCILETDENRKEKLERDVGDTRANKLASGPTSSSTGLEESAPLASASLRGCVAFIGGLVFFKFKLILTYISESCVK